MTSRNQLNRSSHELHKYDLSLRKLQDQTPSLRGFRGRRKPPQRMTPILSPNRQKAEPRSLSKLNESAVKPLSTPESRLVDRPEERSVIQKLYSEMRKLQAAEESEEEGSCFQKPFFNDARERLASRLRCSQKKANEPRLGIA